MPDFYNKMKDRLRTAEQGADTATWLAISDAALKQPSGQFFEGIFLVSKLNIFLLNFHTLHFRAHKIVA